MSNASISRRRRRQALTIVMLFLMASLLKPDAIPNYHLDEQYEVSYVQISNNSTGDSQIYNLNPNTNYGSDVSALIGTENNGESKLVISFPLNFSNTVQISEATVELFCTTSASGDTRTQIFVSALNNSFTESDVTWINRTATNMWVTPGAAHEADHGEWEPPSVHTMNGTFSINVTSLVQHSLLNGGNSIDLLIESIGAQYSCSTKEDLNPSDRPKILITYTTPSGALPSSGAVNPNFINDGMPLMTGDFILAANTLPTLTWNNQVGQGVEIQLSLADTFKNSDDDWWYYSSMTNNTFQFSGPNGQMLLPSENELSNGTTMHYRMRAANSDQIGNWNEGYFHLPNLMVTDNGNNTASVSILPTSLGLSQNLLADTYSSDSSINQNYDGDSVTVGMDTPFTDQYGYHKISPMLIGLHGNATLLQADLVLTREAYNNDGIVSFHSFDSDWEEETLTMGSSGINAWNDGGREHKTSAAIDTFWSNQSDDEFRLDLLTNMQSWLDTSSQSDLSLFSTIRGDYDQHQGLTYVDFYSKEDTTESNQPYLELMYKWGSGVAPNPVSLLSPEDGMGLWNVSNHNLSGNTTPTIEWNGTDAGNNGYEIMWELSNGPEFRNVTASVNTADGTSFAADDGTFDLSTLEAGSTYAWRMKHVDSDGHHSDWSTSSFFIPGITSTWIGGNSYELRLRLGNSSTSGPDMPNCEDTYIDSGSPNDTYADEGELQVSYNSFSEATILLGCDLSSHMLPSGYAVSYANMLMQLSYSSGNPSVGVWDNTQSNWDAKTATWNTYDGVNNWSQSGAKGNERGSLLSTSTISSSLSGGSWITWNTTLGAQDAMRNDGSLDFIIGIAGAGSGISREALLYSGEESDNNRPEIVLVYTPGSDAIPSDPTPISPANSSWSVNTGIAPSPLVRPVLEWNFSSTVGVGGWSVQLDKAETFDSSDLMTFASWNDNGFDTTNLTYSTQQDLDEGSIWYWRVRAVSTTNQLGNWSQTFNFLLPDIEVHILGSNKSAVEYHHHEALPSLNIPEFEDTWIADSGSNLNTSQGADTVLKVGTESDGSQVSSLLRIPLNALPNPNNAHVAEAILNMYVVWGSSTTQQISIHPSLQPWNESATGSTYDGSNNWSGLGGLGSSDSGPMTDVHSVSQTAAWTSFDVTELVQSATLSGHTHLSLMIIGDDAPGLVSFNSVDASSDRPWLNVTWASGNASSVGTSGSPVSPTGGAVLWNSSSHAMIPAGTPTLKWTHANMSSVDAWRVYVWNNASNEREGWATYDSSDPQHASGFSTVGNYTMWTPTSSQSTGMEYKWFVQPIINDIRGVRSVDGIYNLPAVMSGELNSTDAWVNVVEGSLVPNSNYPEVMMDTWINQGAQSVNYGNTSNFTVGRSPSSTLLESRGIIEIDISNLPIPGPYDVVTATLSLYRDGGTQAVDVISVSDLLVPFDENNATWNQASNSANWQIGGASGDLDASLPVDLENISMASTWYNWDVTQLAQAALARGDATVKLLVRAEGGIINGYHTFSSSNHPDISYRPQFNITIRATSPDLQDSAIFLTPFSGQTMWNMSAALPSPDDNMQFSWLSSAVTTLPAPLVWEFQGSNDPRFMTGGVRCLSNVTSSCTDWTFNSTVLNSTTVRTTLSPTSNATESFDIDEWVYWRVRSIEDYRISNWSSINHFRMPDYHGEDDGTGNLTLVLNRGSIFTDTSILPSVPDSTIDSTSMSTNYGTSATNSIGLGSSGAGESRMLIEFDLNEIPFPANMTPTSVVLSMYRSGITGGQSLTIAAYPCASFSESGVNWNNAPTCSSTEITRTTVGAVPPSGYFDWDITSLAQSNVASQNHTLTIMLEAVGTPGATHEFRSSEYSVADQRPTLIFEYVDNSGGVIPPGQATLVSPSDGDVLYDNTNWILESETRPTLQWNPVSNATDYILTIANATGQTKYRSWVDSGFSGTNFSTNVDLAAGESYEWWVQAINGSIPGPSSSRWTFAIGNPVNNTYNSDNTYTYQIRYGEEVPSFGHASMMDSYIDEGNPSDAFADGDLLVGTDTNGDEKRAIIVLDPSQFPLPSNANAHSASVGLYVENVAMNQGVAFSSMTISVHPVLTNGYTPLGTTWDDVTSGTAWGAPGMQSGVDYGDACGSTTISAFAMYSGWIWLDLSYDSLDLTSAHEYVVIATGQGYLDIANSQDEEVSHRPIMLVNYTHVDHVTITPGDGASTDADNTIQYTYAMFDPNGSAVSGPVEWSSTSGSIDSTGLFTPNLAGAWEVSACFGIVCDTVSLSVSPGAPVSWNGNYVSNSGNNTIDAYQTVYFNFAIYDQHNNIVSGETISAISTNGTLTEETPQTGSTHSWSWRPYTAGNQTIQMTWNGQTYTQMFFVVPGSPVLISIGNCGDDDTIVPAGTTCEFEWTVFDSQENEVDKSVLGLVTWTAESPGGNISNGSFTADRVGTWNVNLTSAFGLDANTTVEVVHGAIDYLEINASSILITADDLVYLNTTRVDVRGNRMPVYMPSDNWTVSNGWLTPGSSGSATVWEPETVGSKTIRVNYDGAEAEVIISVSHGIITLMEIDVTTPTNLTADEQSLLKSYGVDSKGNRWSVDVEWMISQDSQNNNDWLYGYVAGSKESAVTFKPTLVGEYNVRAIYTEPGSALNFMVSTDYTITHGELESITMTSPTECTGGGDDDPHWTNDCVWEMTTDEEINFALKLEDRNGNPISDEIVSWEMNGEDITTSMVENGKVWSGVRSEGLYVIRAENGSIFDTISVNISHGRAIVVTHEASANSVEAGMSLTVQMTGTDVAGNTFPQDVTWNNPEVVKTDVGSYQYDATLQGSYALIYELSGAEGGNWTITVAHTLLSEFVIEIDKDTLEQQDSVSITISAFDRFGNPVAVPTGSALTVEATGRGIVTQDNGAKYSVETLDEGEHTITIATLVSGQIVSGSVTYNVTGTIPGFFASGGPLYYAAGGLAMLVVVVLLVLVVVLFRRSTDDYDDDWDDDDDDDDDDEGKPTPVIPSNEPVSEEPQASDDDSYRVDEDGTEWWEDEEGVWWYKEPGDDDWKEWRD